MPAAIAMGIESADAVEDRASEIAAEQLRGRGGRGMRRHQRVRDRERRGHRQPVVQQRRLVSRARFHTSGTRMMKPTSKKIGSPTRKAATSMAHAARSLPNLASSQSASARPPPECSRKRPIMAPSPTTTAMNPSASPKPL